MTLPCIKNLISVDVFQGSPWTFSPSIPDDAKESKETFGRWCGKGSTDHLFFGNSIGINPVVRANSKENQTFALCALIGDFDTPVTQEELLAIKDKLPVELWPNFVSHTFRNHGRAVWLFEKELAMELEPLRTAFLSHAGKTLKAHTLLPGIDRNAWKNGYQMYECGKNWQQFRAEPLTSALLQEWVFNASKKIKTEDLKGEGPEIPLDKVEAAIHKKYPGRWTGPFEVGARGIVVFDTASVNPTASIVTDRGMVCFGQERSFYDWSYILGPAFVQNFTDDRTGRAVDGVWYDGRNYWYKEARGIYAAYEKSALVLKLKAGGLNDNKDKHEKLSEVDAAIHFVNDHHRVDRVAPVIFDPNEIVYKAGKRQLNTARVQAMQPATGEETWGPDGNFPDLSRLFDSWFCPASDLDYFRAWWKRGYESALKGAASRGQALFLGGPVQIGKTFLTNVILSDSFGGHALAADFLQGESIFSKELCEVGLWCIDDAVASKDERGLAKFSEKIKAMVVNPLMSYRAMYHNPESVHWSGRIAVTLNLDVISLKMLPTLDGGVADKLLVLKMKAPDYQFSSDYFKNEAMVKRQLPHLLRWLLDWTPPDYVVNNTRMGVVSYIHPELHAAGTESSGSNDILQVVDIYQHAIDGEWPWEGTAAQILGRLNQADETRGLSNKYSIRSFGRALGLLTGIPDSRVQKAKEHTSGGGIALWRILPPEKISQK